MRTALPLALSILSGLLASGCFFSPIDEGDSTDGEEGRSRWHLVDGLCPGLAGACALDVPVATGATVRVAIELPDRLVVEHTPAIVEGDASIGPITRDPERETITFDVFARSAGAIAIAIVEDGGETIDLARLEARDPVGLECGRLEEGVEVGYAMESLLPDSRELTISRRDEDLTVELGCLVTDAGGEALLGVDVVRWSAADAALLRVSSEPFGSLGGSSTAGARVYVTPRYDGVDIDEGPFTTTLTAALGEIEETFLVTVE